MSYRAKLDASSARYSQLSTQTSCVSASRADSSEACGAVSVEKRIDQDFRKVLAQTLLGHPVLCNLGSDNLQELLESLHYYEIGPNEWLYQAGTPSRQLFFLNTGTVLLRSKTREELIVRPGSIFGDQALFPSLRLESASTLDATTFWSLTPEALQLYTSKLHTKSFTRAKSLLRKNGLEYHLSPPELTAMAQEMLLCHYESGDKIVQQDEQGDLVFYIEKGAVSVVRDGVNLRVMGECEFFGEQALFLGGQRTASVVALDSVQCFAIDHSSLVRSLGPSFDQVIYRNSLSIALDLSPSLSSLPEAAKVSLCSALRVRNCDSVVVPAGAAKGERLYIVLNGILTNNSGEKWLQHAAIGDEDIRREELTGEVHQQDVFPETERAIIAEIGRCEFFETLGLVTTTFNCSKVRVFQDFSPEAKTRLLASVKLQYFSRGQTLVSESSVSRYIYVIKSGTVRISRNGRLLRYFSKFDSVGEHSILLSRGLWLTAVATTEVEAWAFEAAEFASDISTMTKFELTHEAQSESIQMSELLCVEPLGSGQFGSVFYAVTPKPASYAVKCISKRRIDSGNLHHDVLNERKVLMQLNHQMVVRMHRTFRDESCVYFLQEHVNGMLFFDVLLQLGQCTDIAAKFYMGCLVLIFEHLEERRIVYRDLKPENIMVDSSGFLKLIDFGSAKRVIGRTGTVIGTPQYMAPEMILGKSYTSAVDMWSLGVLLYELVCNGVPFGEGQEDTYLVFQQVLSTPLTFPKFVDSGSSVCALVEALLVRDPRERATLQNVMCHEFMSGVSYDSIRARKCSAPYIPRSKDRSKSIRLARQNPKSWTAAVEEEGMDEELELPVKRPGAAPGPDWDEDF